MKKQKTVWNKGIKLSKSHRLNISKGVNKAASEGKMKKVYTKEYRKKIGNRTKGKTYEEIYGKTRADEIKKKLSDVGSWNEGLTKETDARLVKIGRSISKSHKKNKEKRSGENSHFWKGGISRLPYDITFSRELKDLIRKRDKNICQLCHKRKYIKSLDVHHVNYDKKNSLPENLTSLCDSCHSKTNFNRDDWRNLFRETKHIRLINWFNMLARQDLS